MGKRQEKAVVALVFALIAASFFLILYIFKGLWSIITIPQKKKNEEGRRRDLIEKYNDAYVVAKIMNKTIWQGQTPEQLKDSIGLPVDIDTKILKTKKKEVWKYAHQGANRYGLRITLENDLVTGWDEKS